MKPLFQFLFYFSLFSAPVFAQKSPTYEFRAVWVATVDNIDWPSKKGLTTEEQQAEFITLLDMHKRNGMNAIIMQIRPVADAFYPSKYEPWSEFLTGVQGLAPYPYYDPLQFMIEETHKRGMEFHAWLNPYRAVFSVRSSSIAPTHVTRMFPEMAVQYGNNLWFDPGQPKVREYVNKVVQDIVERYDVDAIHFDDYFYPYPIAGKPFPDNASFAKYGNGLDRAAWRRSNVDSTIRQLAITIKKTNPRVKFGISPFGVWRNQSRDAEGSPTRSALSNYDDLFADVLLWLQNGWIDYVAPQLYWETTHAYLDFNTLLDWWSKHTYGRQLYIGHGMYRTFESKSYAWKKPSELPKQIRSIRENDEALGSIYFSSASFNTNPLGWNDSLKNNYYHYPALVPPMHWIDSIAPLQPLAEALNDNSVRVFYRGAEPIKGFAVFTDDGTGTKLVDLIVADKTADLDIKTLRQTGGQKTYIASVDRNNNISKLVELNPDQLASARAKETEYRRQETGGMK